MQLMSSDFLIASGIMYVTMAGKKIFESLAKPNIGVGAAGVLET